MKKLKRKNLFHFHNFCKLEHTHNFTFMMTLLFFKAPPSDEATLHLTAIMKDNKFLQTQHKWKRSNAQQSNIAYSQVNGDCVVTQQLPDFNTTSLTNIKEKMICLTNLVDTIKQLHEAIRLHDNSNCRAAKCFTVIQFLFGFMLYLLYWPATASLH